MSRPENQENITSSLFEPKISVKLVGVTDTCWPDDKSNISKESSAMLFG